MVQIFKYIQLYLCTMTIASLCLLLMVSCQAKDAEESYDVIVLGEGTGAIAAAIQSARSGAETILVCPLPWVGGMLTSAGVSATDGNHKLSAGMWAEWRSLLRSHYGGVDSLFTGWVSNTMYEPHIGEQYWQYLAQKESSLTIWTEVEWGDITKETEWTVEIPSKELSLHSKILVDGTDLGDVAAAAGVEYDLGMDSKEYSQESIAPSIANDIIQDLTYAAILQDYGTGKDMTIDKPDGYDPLEFNCACTHDCDHDTAHECDKMLSYGKLPNNKYMINWPKHGNDYYTNVAELSRKDRAAEYQKAKEKTLRFIYYIQYELGYSHLGIAEDEYDTPDQLPYMPYHREGRRIKGKTRMNVNHILKPFEYSLYRTGIAVGDYPIDHHHAEYPDAPDIDFPSVPSFSIPIACLIPNDINDLVIADKAISVTNIVNGSSRLQPVIIQIGQAAGLMAAMAAKKDVSPSELNIRELQSSLLDANGYIMPYIDVDPSHEYFKAIQKVGATGILKGRPVPFKWANQTWFDTDSLVEIESLRKDLIAFDDGFSNLELLGKYLSQSQVQDIIRQACIIFDQSCRDDAVKIIPYDMPVTRGEFAEILDAGIDLFNLKQVDINGVFTKVKSNE